MTMAPAEGYHLENASTSTLATTIADTAMSAKPVKNPSSESLHYREDEGRLLLTEAHFVLGRLLGVGSFNSVYEAKIDAAKVDLPPQQSSVVATTYALKRPRMRQQPPRRTSSSSSLNNNEDDDKDNNGGGRYKELARQTAIADLEREADLLSGLDHANVIRLHWTIRDASLKGDGPILVMDRLRYTLADKISQWAWAVHDGDEPPTAAADPKHNKTSKAQPRRRFSIGGSKKKATRRRSSMGTALPVIKAKNKKKFLKRADAFLPDRLGAVLDVAEGIKYLHSRGVAHRDLKPENIGFDDEGNAKIFDFGVAKRLNDVSDDSGQTGTLRYMAPEVARSERCNVLDADKYSFALILWEVCSLERAYNDIGRMELSRDVHLLQGGRRGSDGNAGGNRGGGGGGGGGGGDARGSRGKNRKTSSASSGAGRRTRRFSWIDKSRRRGSDNSTVSEHDSTEDEGPLRPKLSPSWPRDVRDVIARCWSDDPRERAPWDEAIGVLRREHEAGGAAGGKGGRPSLCTTTSLSSFSHASDDNKAENNSDDVNDNASFCSNGSSTTSQGLCKNTRVRKSPSCNSILEASAREEGLSSDVESYHTCAEPEEEEEESEWNVHKCNDTTAKEEAARAKWWCSTRRTFQPPSLVPGRNPVPPEEVRCLTR